MIPKWIIIKIIPYHPILSYYYTITIPLLHLFKPYFSPCFIMNYKTIILLPPIKPNYPIFFIQYFLVFHVPSVVFRVPFRNVVLFR